MISARETKPEEGITQMAYLPVVSLSRSQSVRLGRGLGSSVPNELSAGDLAINPQTGALLTVFYANLSDPNVRKDFQHHSTLGALMAAGVLTTSRSSDMFAQAAPAVAAGAGLTVNVPTFTLIGRTFGGVIQVPTSTNLPVAPNVSGASRTDAVVVNNAGQVSVVTGTPSEAGVSEVDTVTITGTPTGGSFTLSGTYDATPFVTSAIAFNASAAAVATAVEDAANYDSTTVATGGPLPGAAVVLTTPGISLSGLSAASSLTGGTPVVTFAQTQAGVLASPTVGGNVQVIATFTVANAATGITGVNSVIPTS
jgi:hypothetical protein